MQHEERMRMSFRLEIVDKMATLASAGLGLVAALAWNDAIQDLFRQLFGTANGLIAKFIYAGFITAVVVLVTVELSRASTRLRDVLSPPTDRKD